MPVGHQDFWVTGSRFYFQREAQEGVIQPFIDLGVVKVISPALDLTKIELKDSDGGIAKVVDQKVTEISETYDITCSNLNGDNLALMFLANDAEAFTQAATQLVNVAHYAYPGRLIKALDANGAFVFGVTSFDFVTKNTTYAVTGVNTGTKTITVAGDQSATITAAMKIALIGSHASADGIKTVVSSTFDTDHTDIVVTEAITSATAAGTIAQAYIKDTDWEVVSLERGIIRMITAGAFAAAANVKVTYTPRAITGTRLVHPQSALGAIKGKAWIVWGRENNARQTVREADVSLTPQSGALNDADYSNFVLQAKVVSDITLTNPAGRLLNWIGELPSVS